MTTYPITSNSTARALLAVLGQHLGDEVKLMPIGSEVPYEGTVVSTSDELVQISSKVDLDTDERAEVHVRVDRIEAIVLLVRAEDDEDGPR